MISKQCAECNEQFSGRIDKKFCSDTCRSEHKNRRNRDVDRRIRHINNVLLKNRRILMKLFAYNEVKITSRRLLYEGFNFDYYTHVAFERGIMVCYCYDYGYKMNKHSCHIRKDKS